MTRAEVIQSKIKRRRAQMLIHSRLYYVDYTSIISDHQWQEWANELRDLQQKYPDLCTIGFFDNAFKDWTGDTGYHLPLTDQWVAAKALRILRVNETYAQPNAQRSQGDV